MDMDKVAKAIEDDAGEHLPGLRDSLNEMKNGDVGQKYTADQLLARIVRKKTGLSQQAFADLIKTPVATLRDWEQGRFSPPGGVICLLLVLEKHPDIIKELAA